MDQIQVLNLSLEQEWAQGKPKLYNSFLFGVAVPSSRPP